MSANQPELPLGLPENPIVERSPKTLTDEEFHNILDELEHDYKGIFIHTLRDPWGRELKIHEIPLVAEQGFWEIKLSQIFEEKDEYPVLDVRNHEDRMQLAKLYGFGADLEEFLDYCKNKGLYTHGGYSEFANVRKGVVSESDYELIGLKSHKILNKISIFTAAKAFKFLKSFAKKNGMDPNAELLIKLEKDYATPGYGNEGVYSFHKGVVVESMKFVDRMRDEDKNAALVLFKGVVVKTHLNFLLREGYYLVSSVVYSEA